MSVEKIDTLIVGGGQAGLAMSKHLSDGNVPHLILEKNRIAERWRSERWDSLVANGPAWHDRYPGLDFSKFHDDAFVPKEDFADAFVDFAKKIDAPIRCGVEVISAKRKENGSTFIVKTSEGDIEANRIVAATGPFQKAIIPPVIPEDAGVVQIHSRDYRNPDQMPEGAVLVVGAGSSGVQIADELMRAGRKVYLSVGPHDRPPRRYRGRDFVWWLGVLGKWEEDTVMPGQEHVTIAVSGAYGGQTVDFRKLAQRGMTLVGRTENYYNGVVGFCTDVAKQIKAGDANYLSILKEADEYIEANGLDLAEEPEAHIIGDDPECLTNPINHIDLEKEGVTSVIWSTGYALDYSWLEVDAFDENGQPDHRRGVSPASGVYFLGLAWLSRRGSPFIWGVWHDAKYLASHIAIQRGYSDYQGDAAPQE